MYDCVVMGKIQMDMLTSWYQDYLDSDVLKISCTNLSKIWNIFARKSSSELEKKKEKKKKRVKILVQVVTTKSGQQKLNHHNSSIRYG
jgi:hypothetical protein